jgi:hypothetical protein
MIGFAGGSVGQIGRASGKIRKNESHAAFSDQLMPPEPGPATGSNRGRATTYAELSFLFSQGRN